MLSELGRGKEGDWAHSRQKLEIDPPKEAASCPPGGEWSGFDAVNAHHCFGTLALSLALQMDVIFMAVFMELNIQIDSLFPFPGLFWEETDKHPHPKAGNCSPPPPQADNGPVSPLPVGPCTGPQPHQSQSPEPRMPPNLYPFTPLKSRSLWLGKQDKTNTAKQNKQN